MKNIHLSFDIKTLYESYYMNHIKAKIFAHLNKPCPVKRIFESWFSKNKISLGRWNTDYCRNKLDTKVDWANEDHCGPCGSAPLQKNQPTSDQSKSSKSRSSR